MLISKLKSKLPPEGKPLLISVYADKSKLSSFGTQKGYPVIARCANLPVEIRNGNGLGGGRVVGWLPIVCFNIYFFFCFSCLRISLRLKKMQLNLENSTMSASNVLSGMSLSASYLLQFINSPRKDIGSHVLMDKSSASSHPFLYFQQIMKSSMINYKYFDLI